MPNLWRRQPSGRFKSYNLYEQRGDFNEYPIAKTFFETVVAAGTNIQINISDAWKQVSAIQINISDTWKSVVSAKINIGDNWKTIF